MSRTLRVVPAEVWQLAEWLGARRQSLTDVPSPSSLVHVVVDQALHAASNGLMQLRWQPAGEAPGFGRLHTEFPLSEIVFDQFMNGRSGYRAQYFLSPEEGVLFNADLMRALSDTIRAAYRKNRPDQSLDLMLTSLTGPHSKVWVYHEKLAFDDAPECAVVPNRWVDSGTRRGTRAPLPSHLMLDLKGAFIHPDTGALFVDELKADRACDLFRCGYA